MHAGAFKGKQTDISTYFEIHKKRPFDEYKEGWVHE